MLVEEAEVAWQVTVIGLGLGLGQRVPYAQYPFAHFKHVTLETFHPKSEELLDSTDEVC